MYGVALHVGCARRLILFYVVLHENVSAGHTRPTDKKESQQLFTRVEVNSDTHAIRFQ